MTFERPLLLALLVLALPALYIIATRDERHVRVITAARTLLVLILVVAAAGPSIASTRTGQGAPTLTVLVDESRSTDILQDMDISFEEADVRKRVIASGNSSDLASGILRHLEPDQTYAVVSDFQSSSSMNEVVRRAQALNATIHAVTADAETEAAVRIAGPGVTSSGVENRYLIHVSSTGEPPTPQVTVDGEKVTLGRVDDNTWAFSRAFTGEGSHVLRASIDSDDHFDVNDAFRRVVHVTEKPDILVVGDRGVLADRLRQFYDVTVRDTLPGDLDSYYAIIVKHAVDASLVPYVSKGNGVVFTGDPKGAGMDVLPVKTVPEDEQQSGATIMLAIDISVSTGESGAVKQSKRIAYNLVEMLPFNNRVGAVAYNRDAFLVSPPRPLAHHRDRLKQQIARLQPQGPSLHHNGLKGARQPLNDSGNIILITDGKIGGLGANMDTRRKTKQVASRLQQRLITIAVGSDANTGFLRDVAHAAGGMFMDASSAGKLKFLFSAGDAAGRAERFVVMDPRHFITDGLTLSGSAMVFDSVAPRRGADLLVTSSGGKPVLTTWRYGLGRVAAFSAGKRDLSRVLSLDPSLVTRTVSWAVGEPRRKQERWIRVEDARRGAPARVEASYPVEGLKRQSDELYTGTLPTDRLGVHSIAGHRYAVNYNAELERVGVASPNWVRKTGGNVHPPDDLDALRDAVTTEQRTVTVRQSLTPPLLVVALLVFLVEVGYRKRRGLK